MIFNDCLTQAVIKAANVVFPGLLKKFFNTRKMTKNEDLLLQHLKKQRRNRADSTPTHYQRSRQKRIQFWQGNKRFCEKSSKRVF